MPSVSCCVTLKRPPMCNLVQLTVLQPHFKTPNRYKSSALSSQLKLDSIPKHIFTMSSPLPSEAPTLSVPRSRIKYALFKSSKKPSKLDEYLIMDQQQSALIRLPLELRTIIWQYVLGGKRIAVREVRIPRTRRFAHYNLHASECVWRAIFQMDDGSRGHDRWIAYLPHGMSLLKTCRLM